MNQNDQDQLLSYLDNNLSDEEKRQFESRLAEDTDLREELEYLRQIQLSLKRRPPERSPGIWEGIEDQFLDDSQVIWPQFEWVGKRLVPLFAAAAVILLAVLGDSNGEVPDDETLDGYFAAQEGLVLSEFEGSTQNILGLNEIDPEEPSRVTQ